ncbi:MAG TPA: DUF2332 domain-containing protein [Nocardioides sp.]|nr:DUF2332 domain-containing protein [Nocardioides sp.]
MQVHGPVVAKYRDFAAYAADDSPCFHAWALGVTEDVEVQEWLADLPTDKQQPNLVFAAARWHGLEAPAPYEALRAVLLGDDGSIRTTILRRATQTNEAGRMATLAPALARLANGSPLALVEVGASAGLCLYPDRWGYRWETRNGVRTAGPAEPTMTCQVTGPAPLPTGMPRVVWRGGVDLNPLDVTDSYDMGWLLTLVWPEHDDRRRLLGMAVRVARADPPALRQGDLTEMLPDLVEEARSAVEPVGGRVVVFHSAVIAYLEQAARARYVETISGLVAEGRCHWVSNEGPGVLPDVTRTGPEPPSGRFVLGIDGRSVGHTHGHGRALHWWSAGA